MTTIELITLWAVGLMLSAAVYVTFGVAWTLFKYTIL
jgi:hypothetical protein